jgi:branched-subunit amino acid transport protein
MFELSPEQILILGLAASILTMLFRFVGELLAKQQISLPEWVWNTIVFGVALVFALLWMPAVFPSFPPPIGDPSVDLPLFFAWLGNVLAVLTSSTSFAIVIYKYLISKVRAALVGVIRGVLFRLG